MFKKMLVGVAIITMCISMIACGNNKKEETTIAPTDEVVEETTVEEDTTEEVIETVEKETETEKEKETETEEATTEEKTTVQETTEKYFPIETTKKAKNTKATKARASRFVGLTISELVDNIGEYNSMKKTKTGNKKSKYNGKFFYDKFTVNAHSIGNDWVIDSVE